MKLTNKHIIITGGSSGIGLALARRLAERNNRVTIVAEDRDKLTSARDALENSGLSVDSIQCDLGVSAEVDDLSETILRNGIPDLLINNAGFGVYRAFESSNSDEIDRLLEVNFVGHVRLTKRLVNPMITRRSGAISFMASVAGRLPITPNATYCAAKHGMLGLASALRQELRRFNIEVTSICPGRVDTPFFDHETFRTRTVGLETKGMVSAQSVAVATTQAIERNRAVTYVPAHLAIFAWAFGALPLLVNPLYDRVVQSRIERLYADIH